MSTVTPSIPTLYDYQDVLVEQLRAAIRAREFPTLLYAPCGAGKGTLAAFMIGRAVAQGYRVLFLVNRRGLVRDLSRRLDRMGVPHGIIMANSGRYQPWQLVQVASIDTLVRRDAVPKADLVFIDEAHFSISPTWKAVIDRFSGVPVIGMTASPIRADGRGLGEFYRKLVLGPSPAELIERGFLVRTRVFAPPPPDLSQVKIQHGEYNQKQLAEVVDKKPLVGDVVDHWGRIGRGRPSVLFGVNRRHAQHCCEQLTSAGIRAVYADAHTPDAERDRLWQRLSVYDVEVACTVDIVSYGWDVPPVSCAIDARPTASLASWLQRIGRIQRTAPGKEDALYLDHAGNTSRFGFAEDEREWFLDGIRRRPRTSDYDPALAVRMCLNCWAAYPSRLDLCPHCGKAYERKIVQPEVVEGTLEEITPDKRPAYTIRHLSKNPKIAELQKIAQERQYRPGWLWHQLKRLREKGELSA